MTVAIRGLRGPAGLSVRGRRGLAIENWAVPGIKGSRGSQGLPGEIGVRGSRGVAVQFWSIPGPKGLRGGPGVRGLRGLAVEAWSVTGPRGSRGPQGDAERTGAGGATDARTKRSPWHFGTPGAKRAQVSRVGASNGARPAREQRRARRSGTDWLERAPRCLRGQFRTAPNPRQTRRARSPRFRAPRLERRIFAPGSARPTRLTGPARLQGRTRLERGVHCASGSARKPRSAGSLRFEGRARPQSGGSGRRRREQKRPLGTPWNQGPSGLRDRFGRKSGTARPQRTDGEY